MKINNENCFYCKKEIKGNVPLIINKLSSIGYQEYNFCSPHCLVSELEKKKYIVTWINKQKIKKIVNSFYNNFIVSEEKSKNKFNEYIINTFLPSYEKIKANERRK